MNVTEIGIEPRRGQDAGAGQAAAQRDRGQDCAEGVPGGMVAGAAPSSLDESQGDPSATTAPPVTRDATQPSRADSLVPVTISLPLMTTLDRVWAEIRSRHPQVPDVVLTFGSGSMGARGGSLKLGHFASDRWEHADGTKPELFIGGEGLALGAQNVLETLLHEAAHALGHARGIQDTSRQGRFHNKRFAALAQELGLGVETTGNIGYSHTTLTAATTAAYAAELAALGEALTTYRHAEAPRGTRSNTSSNNGVAATCDCGRRIRVAGSVLEIAPITCGNCGTDFRAAVPD